MNTFVFTYNANNFKDKNIFDSNDALKEICKALLYQLMIPPDCIVYPLERTFFLTVDNNYSEFLELIRRYILFNRTLEQNCTISLTLASIKVDSSGKEEYTLAHKNPAMVAKMESLLSKLEP